MDCKLLLCWCLLAFGSCTAQRDTTSQSSFTWETKVKDYKGNGLHVTESTVVYEDTQQMLMRSNDLLLRQTPFFRSTSWHDFERGLVALKLEGAKQCFVGKVRNSFQKTLKLLNKHQRKGSRVRRERRSMILNLTDTRNSTGSDSLDEFCNGLDLLFMLEAEPDQVRGPWIRWPPLYCIWAPVDIFYPSELQEIPPFIRDWQGPFGPFC